MGLVVGAVDEVIGGRGIWLKVNVLFASSDVVLLRLARVPAS
jgi:hypothetical protein